MSTPIQNNFLNKLKHEAHAQAKLQHTRILPQELDAITSFIGRKPWQVILVSSGVTSLALELLKWIV